MTDSVWGYVNAKPLDNTVLIRDCSNLVPYPAKSVTNDAENVVAEIYKTHGNVRIFYYDTMGNKDELLHENGVFKGFAPGPR